MKMVMINAYTGFNLGDDIFIKILCDKYPNTKFVLYAPKDYKYTFSKMENLKVISNSSIFIKVIDLLSNRIKGFSVNKKRITKKCDASIYIGGSLFMQNDSWRKSLASVKNMKIENQPFFLLGANFGPFNDNQFYLEYKNLFKQFTDVCFRERYSYELFQDLDNVRLAADIVFQLKSNLTENSKMQNIVISVIKPSLRKDLLELDDVYYEKIKEISSYFVEKGYQVTLMSFCEYEGDKEAVDIIYNLIPEKYKNNINRYYYKLNIYEALNIIANSKFIIATRFHSMVLGWVYNKPVFPIVYSQKMTNVMNDAGFNGAFCDIHTIDTLDPKIVFNSIETNQIDVTKQIADAEKHFEKLNKYLLNE